MKKSPVSYYLKSLCVYDFENDPVLQALAYLLEADAEETLSAYALFFKRLSTAQTTRGLKGYITKCILMNENVFTRAAAAKEADALPLPIIAGVKSDLEKLEAVANLTPEQVAGMAGDPEAAERISALPSWDPGTPHRPFSERWAECIPALCQYHQEHGYGIFARYKAFAWRDEGLEGRIVPVSSSNPIRLTDLKSYQKQRQAVVDNTESFILGLPANNCLLYGDRGTGKSSTVHAVLNEFAPRGLRMIEMPKSAIHQFPLLLEQLMDSPMKFIVFIDDLSFSSDDDDFAQLKAALEGSVSARQPNTLIYATSNRRHLIKETFSGREGDELHRGDTIQEQLSLSDRFGLSITFVNPDRNRFYEILDGMALDRGLDVELEKLHQRAEQWALNRGGRSPRAAKQFIDAVESKVKRRMEW